jgi:multidrug resistance efflux pump
MATAHTEGHDNGNGRITMAVLGSKLDALTEAFKQEREENRRWRESQEQRLRMLEQGQETRREQITSVREQITDVRCDVDDLKRRDYISGGFGAAAAIVAGLAAYFGK